LGGDRRDHDAAVALKIAIGAVAQARPDVAGFSSPSTVGVSSMTSACRSSGDRTDGRAVPSGVSGVELAGGDRRARARLARTDDGDAGVQVFAEDGRPQEGA
jgi:hypothetical protein